MLPKIYNPNPVVIAAVAEQQYPDSYMYRIVLSPPTATGDQSLVAIFRPYDQATGTMYPSADRDFEMNIPGVFAESSRAPLLGQAMGTLIYAASLLLEEKTQTDPKRLAEVKATLGVVEPVIEEPVIEEPVIEEPKPEPVIEPEG